MSVRLRAAAACALIAAATAPAASAEDSLSNVAGFNIKTSQFQYNLNSGNFTLPDPFTAIKPGTDIAADKGNGNSGKKVMHAEGHVVLHETQAPISGGKTGDLAQRPSTLTTDVLDVDGARKLYTATGNMHFSQAGGRDATADKAILDDAKHMLYLQGNVKVRNGEQTIDADTLIYNVGSGQIDGQGNVTITSPVETPGPRPARTAGPKKKRLFGR